MGDRRSREPPPVPAPEPASGRTAIHPSVRALLLAAMRQFPASGAVMKRVARQRGGVAISTTDMLEAFAGETRRHLRCGDHQLAAGHLAFMSRRLAQADAAEREYIDVYYTEGLLFDLGARERRAMWTLMPENLRRLHVAMWGPPAFR